VATQKERSEATQQALIETASLVFASDGFAGAATPNLTGLAGVSRGALYHHFGDKAGLLRAVLEKQLKELATIVEASPRLEDPVDDLINAGEAYLDAMQEQGRVRLLYVEGPAVLGMESMRELDQKHGVRTLRDGVARAVREGAIHDVDVDATADLLSALYEMAATKGTTEHRQALRAFIEGLRASRSHVPK